MNSDTDLLDALADAFAAAGDALRARARNLTVADGPELDPSEFDVVAQARRLHGALGPRQAEVLVLLREAGPAGTNTGVLSRRMRYTQPNVHLTLKELVRRGLVVKDEKARPHNYRLAPRLAP